MENTTQKLNEMAKTYFDGLNFNLKPITVINVGEMSSETGVTIVPINQDAYNLKSCIAGNLKHYNKRKGIDVSKVEGKGGPVAYYRGIISYSFIPRMLENPALFLFTMMHNINIGLQSLNYELGDLENYDVKLTFSNRKDYFMDIESHAAVEFRMCVVNK